MRYERGILIFVDNDPNMVTPAEAKIICGKNVRAGVSTVFPQTVAENWDSKAPSWSI